MASANIKHAMIVIIISNRFTVCMVYYGLSLGVGALSSSLYVGFALSGFVETFSNFLSLFAMERLVSLLDAGHWSSCCVFQNW